MLLLIVAAMFGANQPAEDTTAKWGDGFVVRGDADDLGAAPDPVPIRHSAPLPLRSGVSPRPSVHRIDGRPMSSASRRKEHSPKRTFLRNAESGNASGGIPAAPCLESGRL